MTRRSLALMLLIVISRTSVTNAGGLFRKVRETVGGHHGPAMTNVPHWAAERMRNSSGPMMVPQTGRRPWAYALSNLNTQSAHMARYYQLGGGVGPVPDASNGFSGPFGPFSTWNAPIP